MSAHPTTQTPAAPTPRPIVRRVTTLQPDRRERLRRVRWYQVHTRDGRPVGYPQPTAALARSYLTAAQLAEALTP